MIITGHVVDDIGYQMLELSDSFSCHLHIPLFGKDYYTMLNADVHSYLRIEIRTSYNLHHSKTHATPWASPEETVLAGETKDPPETDDCAP